MAQNNLIKPTLNKCGRCGFESWGNLEFSIHSCKPVNCTCKPKATNPEDAHNYRCPLFVPPTKQELLDRAKAVEQAWEAKR